MPNTKGYIALVAADAFGYGADAVVVRLMLSGADAFAVTDVHEAMKVREVGSGWQIIVLGSTLEGEECAYFEHALTPVLSCLEEAKRFEDCAEKLKSDIRVHIRLPIFGDAIPSEEEAKKLFDFIETSKHLKLEAFSLAGTGTGAPNEGAEANPDFLEYVAKKLGENARGIYIHHSDVCDTSVFPKNLSKSMRAGLVLFGMTPSQRSILKGFKPEKVLRFRSSVSQIKTLPAGASIGYSRKYELKKDAKVALISAGYGDGLARGAGSGARVLIRGKFAPIIGVVSMDQASIDVSDFDEIEVGDEAVIVGESGNESISIEEYCNALGITPAQALTSITKRVARFYKTLY